MNFTLRHALAIIEMDNEAWIEGIDLEGRETQQAWNELVRVAEEMTGTKTDCTNFRENPPEWIFKKKT